MRAAVMPIGLTISSAALYASSFPPLSVGFVAWIALVPFLVAAGRVRPVGAAALGLLWTVVAAYGVGWWFPEMIVGYFELRPVWGWVGFGAAAVALAGAYLAAFAAWMSWLVRRGRADPVLVAMGWGAAEFARARLLVPNPWALSAYSQVNYERLTQIADLAGPYGIGMLIAGTNAALAGLFVPGLRGTRHAVSCVVIAAALSAALVYGDWRLGQSFAAGYPRRIAVVQGAIERGFRWRPEHRRAGLDRYVELSRIAAAERPDLVLWPEYAVSFYPQEASPERLILLETAQTLGFDLMLGAPHYAFATGDTIYHNSVFLVRGGTIAGRYDKMHPLPLAERPLLGGALGTNGTPYSAGKDLGLLRAAGMRLGVFICVESVYPELIRRLASAGAEVLAEFSNDAWFTYEAPARHRLDMASLRAIENRRHLIRAASTGISAVIDPHGRVHKATPLGEPAVLVGTVRPSPVITPYQLWGDLLPWLGVGVVGAHWLTRRGSRRRGRTRIDTSSARGDVARKAGQGTSSTERSGALRRAPTVSTATGHQ